MASSTFFIPSVNVIGADSLTDAMNMMADYGFTRTLIVTDNMLTKLGMAGDVQKALEERGITPISSELEWLPLNTVKLTDEQAEDVFKLIERVEQDDDVQQVFHNMG